MKKKKKEGKKERKAKTAIQLKNVCVNTSMDVDSVDMCNQLVYILHIRSIYILSDIPLLRIKGKVGWESTTYDGRI